MQMTQSPHKSASQVEPEVLNLPDDGFHLAAETPRDVQATAGKHGGCCQTCSVPHFDCPKPKRVMESHTKGTHSIFKSSLPKWSEQIRRFANPPPASMWRNRGLAAGSALVATFPHGLVQDLECAQRNTSPMLHLELLVGSMEGTLAEMPRFRA